MDGAAKLLHAQGRWRTFACAESGPSSVLPAFECAGQGLSWLWLIWWSATIHQSGCNGWSPGRGHVCMCFSVGVEFIGLFNGAPASLRRFSGLVAFLWFAQRGFLVTPSGWAACPHNTETLFTFWHRSRDPRRPSRFGGWPVGGGHIAFGPPCSDGGDGRLQ